MNHLRPIEVRMSLPEINSGAKGFFHGWAEMPFFDNALEYPLRKTFALIEFSDGQVKLLDPETIRFVEPSKNLASQ